MLRRQADQGRVVAECCVSSGSVVDIEDGAEFVSRDLPAPIRGYRRPNEFEELLAAGTLSKMCPRKDPPHLPSNGVIAPCPATWQATISIGVSP